MATALSPSEVAKKWAENAIRNKATMLAGVAAVTENPAAKAARAVDKYAAGVAQAVSDGTYVRALQAVTIDGWKASIMGKGSKNYDTGVREAESKMDKFYQSFIPFTAQLSKRIQAMPKSDIEDSINRVRANIMGMKEWAKSRPRG